MCVYTCIHIKVFILKLSLCMCVLVCLCVYIYLHIKLLTPRWGRAAFIISEDTYYQEKMRKINCSDADVILDDDPRQRT